MNNKVYSLWGKAVDSNGETHYVTVVGLYNKETRYENTMEDIDNDVTLLTHDKYKVRTLKLGASICHPSDEFNEEVGISIAKSRAKRTPIGTVESRNITMLNADACTALVFTELRHIINHIDDYID